MRGEQTAFTWKARSGVIDRIIMPVVVWPAFDPADPPDALPASIKAQALWDTGATRSLIASELAQDLGLTAVGKGEVQHGGGSDDRLRYVVNFGLPNRVIVAGVLVSEQPGKRDFNVIVGMDVITLGDFTITNAAGHTWVSFRMPSSARTDYVVELDSKRFAGVGRNDPCPCGSGKKFKACHKPKFDQARRATAPLQVGAKLVNLPAPRPTGGTQPQPAGRSARDEATDGGRPAVEGLGAPRHPN